MRHKLLLMLTLTAVATATLSACTFIPTKSETVDMDTKESGSVTTMQDGAPYPADMEHLKEIVELSDAHELPKGATDIAVAPAVKFAESYPGGWGYVISFHAEEHAIRDYFEKHTGLKGENIEIHRDSKANRQYADIDISAIKHPIVVGFGNTQLALERPLGRCWLLIRGGGR